MNPAQEDGAVSGGRGRAETAVAAVSLLLLLVGCFLVLMPFLSAILWAALLCFSTWEPYGVLKGILGGRSTLAALVTTLVMAAVAVVPFVIVGYKLADNVTEVFATITRALHNGLPHPPSWIQDLPLVGSRLYSYLDNLAQDPAALQREMGKLVGPSRTYAIGLGKSIGRGVLEVSLSLLICFFIYRDGDAIESRINTIAFRLAGARGSRLLEVARVTVRGVVHGIIGTSLIQGLLGGIGFWIAGVPGAFFLGFATFVAAFIPLGPALIWLPAAVWLYEQNAGGWAIFLIVWGVVVGVVVDQVLKPIIISRTGTTPLILVMLGVFGGALAFGFIGLFIGPTLLAVMYRIVDEWSGQLAE